MFSWEQEKSLKEHSELNQHYVVTISSDFRLALLYGYFILCDVYRFLFMEFYASYLFWIYSPHLLWLLCYCVLYVCFLELYHVFQFNGLYIWESMGVFFSPFSSEACACQGYQLRKKSYGIQSSQWDPRWCNQSVVRN